MTHQTLNADDPVIWRSDLHKLLSVSSETVRRWIESNKLPAPDVDLSRKTRGWRLTTLRAHGINLPV